MSAKVRLYVNTCVLVISEGNPVSMNSHCVDIWVLFFFFCSYFIVTEVIWEGEEADLKDTNAGKSSSDSVKNSNGQAGKVEENGPANPVNR